MPANKSINVNPFLGIIKRELPCRLTGDQTFMRLHGSSVNMLYKKCFLHNWPLSAQAQFRLQSYDFFSRLRLSLTKLIGGMGKNKVHQS